MKNLLENVSELAAVFASWSPFVNLANICAVHRTQERWPALSSLSKQQNRARESLEAEAASLNDAQRAELDYRIERHEKNPTDVIAWKQVRANLYKKP